MIYYFQASSTSSSQYRPCPVQWKLTQWNTPSPAPFRGQSSLLPSYDGEGWWWGKGWHASPRPSTEARMAVNTNAKTTFSWPGNDYKNEKIFENNHKNLLKVKKTSELTVNFVIIKFPFLFYYYISP